MIAEMKKLQTSMPMPVVILGAHFDAISVGYNKK